MPPTIPALGPRSFRLDHGMIILWNTTAFSNDPENIVFWFNNLFNIAITHIVLTDDSEESLERWRAEHA